MYFNPKDIEHIAQQLKAGKIGIFPCDTILGIIAIPNKENVQRIQQIKKRPDCPFILLISSLKHLNNSCKPLSNEQEKIVKNYWPGPLTLIFDKLENDSTSHASTKNTIGLRYPDFLPLNYLLDTLDSPILSTSVNLHQEPAALTKKDINESILNSVDFCYTDTISLSNKASTIVDLSNNKVSVIRQGDLHFEY